MILFEAYKEELRDLLASNTKSKKDLPKILEELIQQAQDYKGLILVNFSVNSTHILII